MRETHKAVSLRARLEPPETLNPKPSLPDTLYPQVSTLNPPKETDLYTLHPPNLEQTDGHTRIAESSEV